MAAQDSVRADGVRTGSRFYDPRVRSIVFQAALVLAIVFFLYVIVTNTQANLERQNIASGFGFLGTTAGFGIIQTLIDYAESSSYGRALVVGILNTLLVAALGVIVATVLGFVIGIARLSSNWLISRIAYLYIEIVRNVPLLLQLFFWYFAVLRSVPNPRNSLALPGSIFVNNRGIYVPSPVFEAGSLLVGIALLAAVGFVIGLRIWSGRRQMATGQRFPVLRVGLAVLFGVPILALLLTGVPIALDLPELKGFNFVGGVQVGPEFVALLLALALYTAAFIAEIVRAGILAVSHGQTEASYALGLRPNMTLRLVVIPQALRVIVPPLTNQYLNLTKNSSLAVAIAYPDLVSVGGTILNQTGQAIEIIGVWMLVYLSISLCTSAFMNWYNQRIALVER